MTWMGKRNRQKKSNPSSSVVTPRIWYKLKSIPPLKSINHTAHTFTTSWSLLPTFSWYCFFNLNRPLIPSVHAKSLQLWPTLCDPTDCSLPGSSGRGILQVGYWSALPCPPPGDLPNPGIKPRSPTLQILYHWATRETPIWIREI